MPFVSTLSQRAQSPDVLMDKHIIAHETLSYSTDAISWQPCPNIDAHDEPTILDAPDNHQDSPGLKQHEVPEHEHTLTTRYAAMLEGHSETQIFDVYSSVKTDQYATELRRVLTQAFSLQDYVCNDIEQLMNQITSNSNYSVENVTRVMNKKHYRMHQSFAENYEIKTTRTVYHGTSQAGAKSIQTVGFKGSAGRRAKFGKGIYSSPIVWEAIGYSKPYHDARQVFFVVEMLQGPTALGSEDQVDFGVDDQGAEILTLKNPEDTILCASKENQMLATYRITVRYNFEKPFLFRHRECIRVVHPDIALLIKHARANAEAAAAAGAQATPLPDAAAAALASVSSNALKLRLQYVAGLKKMALRVQIPAPPAAPPAAPAFVAPPGYMHVDYHNWFQEGQKVHITKTLKAYREFSDKPGVICRIVKAPCYFFCVRLDDINLRESVQRLNALPENKLRFHFLTTNEQDLVVLKVDQLERYMTRAEIKESQHNKLSKKRKSIEID